jgi:hypothetical protein
MTRQDYGTGTIREIKTGKDAGAFRGYLIVDGKRRSFWAKTREDVERKMLDARHAKAHGLPIAPPRTWTVKAYALDWLEDQRAHVRIRLESAKPHCPEPRVDQACGPHSGGRTAAAS